MNDLSSSNFSPVWWPHRGTHTICLGSRLLFYSKCTRFTVCLTYSHISLTVYIKKTMINKRWITLPVVYSRPFASKAVFERFWMNFSSPLTLLYIKEESMANWNSFKIVQKTAFEAKGQLYITGKVIQCLFIIDLYTQLAIYGYRWDKR